MERRSRKSKRRMNSIFIMLLLSAVLMIASTYAWFTVNREVEINGITARVAAAEGLQISLDGKSWKSAVDVSKADLETITTEFNNYIWPDEISPVSTIGQTTDGILDFFAGDISADGTKLENAKKLSEAQTSDQKYIAFDIYLKNSSARTIDEDPLRLGAGSSVAIHNPNGTDTTDDRVGNTDTGLENCIRTAIVLYNNPTSTGSIPTLSAGQAVYKNIGPTNGVKGVSIWEPNYKSHIQEIVDNDTDRVPNTSANFRTLGIKALPAAVGGVVTLTSVNEAAVSTGNTNYLAEVSTVKTLGTSGTSEDAAIDTADSLNASLLSKATGSGNLTLEPNKVSKARIYIYLEGQDPDCTDTASTGRWIDINMKLNKPAREP